MDLSVFKDPELAKGLIHSIQKWAPEQATLMEVCVPTPLLLHVMVCAL